MQLGLSCDGEGKSFPVGSPFRIQALQVKSVLGGSSPFQASSCSLQIRGGILFYIGLFDYGPHLPDTSSAELETSVRYEHKQRFSV